MSLERLECHREKSGEDKDAAEQTNSSIDVGQIEKQSTESYAFPSESGSPLPWKLSTNQFKAILAPARCNYEEERQQIEDKLAGFYNSVSESWLERHDVEVIKAPEMIESDHTDISAISVRLSAGASEDEVLPYLPKSPSPESSKDLKKESRRLKRVPANKRGRSKRKPSSREDSPEDFTPRQSKPLRKHKTADGGGFFTWVGSIFGCFERY